MPFLLHFLPPHADTFTPCCSHVTIISHGTSLQPLASCTNGASPESQSMTSSGGGRAHQTGEIRGLIFGVKAPGKACCSGHSHHQLPNRPPLPYRSTSLIRNRAPSGPYSRTMPRLLWRT